MWLPGAHATLPVIAAALAASAAIELAYTLFTPGPDEALDPLMLGLSAGILYLVSESGIPATTQFAGIFVGVIALGVLFLVRARFLETDA